MCQLGGEYYIEIPFYVGENKPFTAGCYIVYNGWNFFLKKDAFPEPVSGSDSLKYTLKFYAPQHYMEQCLMKWLVGGNKELTFKLTTTLDEFAKLLVENMSDYHSYKETGFRWVYNTSLRNDTREVSFDGISCWDAMKRIAEAFNVECWISDINILNGVNELQINFGKLYEGNDREEIREGEVVTRFPASKRGEDNNYGTRFYIYGSAKNIPDDYYENVTGGVTNHISEKRLHLPDGKAYINILNGEEVDVLPEGRIIERSIILEDIFPKNTSTVSAVEERKETIIDGREDYAYSVSSSDSGFSGADDDVLSTLGITFTSGALSGSSFDVRWNKSFDNKFHIQPRVEGTSGSEQIVIPNQYLKPSIADTFVLTGIRLPESKVKEAEQELYTQGVAKAKEYSADTNVYDCKTNPVYCQQHNKNFRIGRRVKLIGGAFGEAGRMSRIQGFEKALWNEYDATYSIGDNNVYSRVKAIAKGLANDSGRIVRQEATRWENKAQILSMSGTTDLTDIKNQVALNTANLGALNQRVMVAFVEGESSPEHTDMLSLTSNEVVQDDEVAIVVDEYEEVVVCNDYQVVVVLDDGSEIIYINE